MSQFREFWIYRNEEYAPTYACDFNQRGFVASRNKESIHVIEYSAYEAAQKEIEKLTAALKVAEDALLYMTEDYDCDAEDVALFDKRKAEEALAEIQKIKKGLG